LFGINRLRANSAALLEATKFGTGSGMLDRFTFPK